MAETETTRNEDIADVFLLQALTLAQLEAGEQARIEALLLPLWRRIRRQVALDDPTDAPTLAGRLRQMTALLVTVDAQIAKVFGEIAATHQETRDEVAAWQVESTAESLDAIGEAALVARELRPGTVDRVASTALILGASALTWWSRQAATVQRAVGDRWRQLLLQEQPLKALVEEITPIARTATRAADGLAQTSLASVTQAVQARTVANNRRTIIGTQWHTTFDSSTCPVCFALGGQAWTQDHEPLAGSGPWPGEPPKHWHCRCVLTVLVRGEAPAQDLRFEPWLRAQTEAQQRAILGPGRFELWQAGKIQLHQLVDQRHRPLTLKELRSESAA